MSSIKKIPSLLIFGPPGVGKGTLCKFLSGSGTLFHLSSGDIFRGLSKESETGKIFHSYAGKGNLVPDDVVIQVCHEYIDELINTNKYSPAQQYMLLDGMPRTAAQTKLFDQYIDVRAIIVLEVTHQEELIRRLQGRAIIENRSDDADIEVLKRRMDVYKKETSVVLEHYPKHLIHRINAEQRPLEVVRDVLVELSSLLAYPPK